MIACSFLPAATRMIYDMGLQHLLQGVTFECHQPPGEEKPRVVHCIFEGREYSSAEIDAVFSACEASGKSIYYADQDLLQQIAPDIVFTQDVCDVCQIDTACTAAAIAGLVKQPQVISLTPRTLNEVFDTAVIIAKALGREEVAYHYLAGLQKRTERIIDQLRRAGAVPQKVMAMEWIDPVYNCGHWIPHQVSCAGGTDMLGNPSGYSVATSWNRVVNYNPEVIVVAPCGFNTDRAAKEIHLLTAKPGWDKIAAVEHGRVFLADYDLFTQPAPSTLVDGIELLAACFHPALFDIPGHLEHKIMPLEAAYVYR